MDVANEIQAKHLVPEFDEEGGDVAPTIGNYADMQGADIIEFGECGRGNVVTFAIDHRHHQDDGYGDRGNVMTELIDKIRIEQVCHDAYAKLYSADGRGRCQVEHRSRRRRLSHWLHGSLQPGDESLPPQGLEHVESAICEGERASPAAASTPNRTPDRGVQLAEADTHRYRFST